MMVKGETADAAAASVNANFSCSVEVYIYRGTSLIRNCPPLGPYSRPTPLVVLGGAAVSDERGTPVCVSRGGERGPLG